MQEPRFLPCVRGGNPAVPTHVPALHAPLPLPCWPRGARLGPWPFPLLLPLSWQLLAQLQPDTVLGPEPFIAGWLLICFSTGPRSPRNGMLHGSPAPEPHSMLRLELERICHSWAAPLLPGSSVLGQQYPLHIPPRVGEDQLLSHSPQPSLLCAWGWRPGPASPLGPAHDNPTGTPQTAAVVSCPC